MRVALSCVIDTSSSRMFTRSLHDALPISPAPASSNETGCANSARGHAAATTPSKSTTGSPSQRAAPTTTPTCGPSAPTPATPKRSEEHTSELQSRENLVCRLLHEKKKKIE